MSIVGGLVRRILDAMVSRKVNQVRLAELLQTGQSTISGWKNGTALPDARALERLPTLLRISGHWLLTGEGSMDPPTSQELEPYQQARFLVSREMREAVINAVTAALPPIELSPAAHAPGARGGPTLGTIVHDSFPEIERPPSQRPEKKKRPKRAG